MQVEGNPLPKPKKIRCKKSYAFFQYLLAKVRFSKCEAYDSWPKPNFDKNGLGFVSLPGTESKPWTIKIGNIWEPVNQDSTAIAEKNSTISAT